MFKKKSIESFNQDKIIICIKTTATHKNNIIISPFLSDKNGHIAITKNELITRKDLFISYGLMDYESIECAKPEIEICLLGKLSIENEINFLKRILQSKTDLELYNKLGDKAGKRVVQFAKIERQERQDLGIFQTCFNYHFKFRKDVTLIADCWDNPCSNKNYKAVIAT